MEKNTKSYFELVRQWAEDRNLILGSSPTAQLQKFFEEAGELARAVAEQDRLETIDAIGDCFVVLTILAAQLELDVTAEECQIHERLAKFAENHEVIMNYVDGL